VRHYVNLLLVALFPAGRNILGVRRSLFDKNRHRSRLIFTYRTWLICCPEASSLNFKYVWYWSAVCWYLITKLLMSIIMTRMVLAVPSSSPPIQNLRQESESPPKSLL
jgi:hypothetical protein